MLSICLRVSFFPVFASLIFACSESGKTFPLIEQKCGKCHTASIVYQKNRTEDDWKRVIHGMKMRGLVLTKQEEQDVMKVLTENFLLKN